MFTSSATLVLIAIYLEQFVLCVVVSFLIRTLVKQLADEIKLEREKRAPCYCSRDTSRCQLVIIIILSVLIILIMEMSEEPPVAGERSGHTVTARLKNKGFNSCTDVIMSSLL